MGYHGSSHHIENEAAYEDAIRRRIIENATKGKIKRFYDAYGTERADQIMTYVRNRSEKGSSFYRAMLAGIEKYGAPTEKQIAIILRDLDADATKMARRKAERRAIDSGSKHVSEVGKRDVFTLTIQAITRIETDFGIMHIYKLTDASGNIVIYKGASLGMDIEVKTMVFDEYRWHDRDANGDKIMKERVTVDRRNFVKGNTLTGKATVKAHNDRDGIAQTIISRPKFTIVE